MFETCEVIERTTIFFVYIKISPKKTTYHIIMLLSSTKCTKYTEKVHQNWSHVRTYDHRHGYNSRIQFSQIHINAIHTSSCSKIYMFNVTIKTMVIRIDDKYGKIHAATDIANMNYISRHILLYSSRHDTTRTKISHKTLVQPPYSWNRSVLPNFPNSIRKLISNLITKHRK